MIHLPFLTVYDPPGSSEGTLDPLGLYMIADQLATRLVPAVRERIDADFAHINELRNTVFHLCRGIAPKDTDRLRRFRDKPRYDRELSARQRTELAGAGT